MSKDDKTLTTNNTTTDVSFLDSYAGQGTENISLQDVSLPFLRILQSLSPQCQEGTESYIPDAKPGMFYNSLNGKVYGRSIKLIPVKYERTWLEFKPERQGFVATHAPDSVPVDKTDFNKWKNSDNGNEIVDTMTFYCLIADDLNSGMVVFPLTKSFLKHARKWNSLIMTDRLPNGKHSPIFANIWELETVINKNDKGTFYCLGDDTTKIKKVRFINQIEASDFVLPSIKDVESLNQKVITAGITEYNDPFADDAKTTGTKY